MSAKAPEIILKSFMLLLSAGWLVATLVRLVRLGLPYINMDACFQQIQRGAVPSKFVIREPYFYTFSSREQAG